MSGLRARTKGYVTAALTDHQSGCDPEENADTTARAIIEEIADELDTYVCDLSTAVEALRAQAKGGRVMAAVADDDLLDRIEAMEATNARLRAAVDELAGALEGVRDEIFEMEDMDHVQRMEWFETTGLDLYDLIRRTLSDPTVREVLEEVRDGD